MKTSKQAKYFKSVLIISAALLLFTSLATAETEENMTEPEWDEENEVYLISNITELNWIRNDLQADYKLIDDIDASETQNWNDGKGWKPIGTEDFQFLGNLDGQNQKIFNLHIQRPSERYVGLFGHSDGEIDNLNALEGNITGDSYVGILVGETEDNSIVNDVDINGYVESTDTSWSYTGGLIGYNNGEIYNSSSSAEVKGSERVGGLVGRFKGRIENSWSNGTINGTNQVGGLVGSDNGRIRSSYSEAEVYGEERVGGLTGYSINIDIRNSHSNSKVEGKQGVGGLIGYASGSLDVVNTYSRSQVTADNHYGGLIGWNVIDRGEVRDSFWDIEETGIEDSAGGTGKTTDEMKDILTFENDSRDDLGNAWDIEGVSTVEEPETSYTWNIVDGESYPFLSWEELEEGNNTLTLEVTDEDSEPVEDVAVQIDSFIEETDSDGEAVFENLHETSYTAIADKEGYHENSLSFQITEEEQTEKLTLEEKSSTFEITELDLNPENVEEGETVQANTTVNNTGSETGKRNLELKTDNEIIGEETIELEEGQDEVISFEFSKQEEGEHGITAEIFEENKTETLTVGPELFNLEIKKTPETAGNTTPETGNYTYEEGEAVTVEAEPDLGWSFIEWNGVNKETEEITLTMDEDKQLEAVFEEDIDIEIGEVAVPKTENGELEFNYQIVNQNETITENLTVEFNDREIIQTEETVSEGETLESENNSFDLISGDASENAKLKISYAGVTDERSFKIGAIEKQLVEGWNYFSLPIATSEKEPIQEILDTDKIETVWTHQNGEWKNYNPQAPENELNNFEGGKGYLVESNEEFTIHPPVTTNLTSIESENPVGPAQNQLDSGFSLIGSYWTTPKEAAYSKAFQSLPEDSITSIYGTSEQDGNLGLDPVSLGSDEIKPGQAYWIALTEGNKTYTKPTVK